MIEVLVVFKENYIKIVDPKTLQKAVDDLRELGLVFRLRDRWTGKDTSVDHGYISFADHNFIGSQNYKTGYCDILSKVSECIKSCMDGVEFCDVRYRE